MPRPKIEAVIDDIDLPDVDENFTVVDAQKIIEHSLVTGDKEDCRCCGRLVKRYQKKLSPILAARLLTFACRYLNAGGDRPVPLPSKPGNKTCNFEDLTNWGLVKMTKERDENAKRTKLAILTKKGYDFVIGNNDVPLHLFFFNNEIIGEGTEDVDIDDVLDDIYDYHKLIAECDKLMSETQVG